MSNEDYHPCECEQAGFCTRYANVVTPNMHQRCKNSAHYRKALETFFIDDLDKGMVNKEQYEHQQKQKQERQLLDEVIYNVEKAGVDATNEEVEEGLGTVLANVFSKFGITEEKVEEWSGMGGCGCSKRKKFLNKILPFKKTK